MLRYILIVAALLVAAPAHAQRVTPTNLGTAGTVTQVALGDGLRKRIVFHNPNAVANIWVCPALSSLSNAITCAAGVAGSFAVIPRGNFTLDGNAILGGPGAAMGQAWNAVSDTNNASITVLELD
jgi:hypothetical protein